jgi:hypothetical protein
MEGSTVLNAGGVVGGFDNPVVHIFDGPGREGIFEVKYPLPFDATRLSEDERRHEFGDDWPIEFSHSLDEQIGGQLGVGFLLTGLYEDRRDYPLGKYMPSYFAPRAIKPRATCVR